MTSELELDVVDVHITLAPVPARDVTINDVIDWIRRRPPQVAELLRQHEASVAAQGPEVVAARVAEGKRFLGALPVRKALALIDALVDARAS